MAENYIAEKRKNLEEQLKKISIEDKNGNIIKGRCGKPIKLSPDYTSDKFSLKPGALFTAKMFTFMPSEKYALFVGFGVVKNCSSCGSHIKPWFLREDEPGIVPADSAMMGVIYHEVK